MRGLSWHPRTLLSTPSTSSCWSRSLATVKPTSPSTGCKRGMREEAVNFPTEFLQSLELPNFPQHKLELKKGAPIMLLRNLDPPRLCNGTRLMLKKMLPHVLEAEILLGKYAGERVLTPRIPLTPSDTDMPIPFERLQFPVKLSFAMTINKSQGQSLKMVGLHLDEPVFAHGQLYVGCSRVGKPEGLYILQPEGKTKNIVYHEALA